MAIKRLLLLLAAYLALISTVAMYVPPTVEPVHDCGVRYYGVDPHYMDGRLFENFRNGKELF